MTEARRPATIGTIALSWIALGIVDLALPAARADPIDRALLTRPVRAAPTTTAKCPARAAPAGSSAPIDAKALERHDRELWPCAGLRGGAAECVPDFLPLARGRLERARDYLRGCRLCADRARVDALRRQLESLVSHLETERREPGFQAALAAGEFVAAAQLLADAELLDERWRARAVRMLTRRDPALAKDYADCGTPAAFSLLLSPALPEPGTRLRVVFAADEEPGAVEIELDAAQRKVDVQTTASGGGPPFFRVGEVELGARGTYRVSLRAAGRRLACRAFSVRWRARPDRGAGVWTSGDDWDHSSERLYSVWLEHLFEAPEGTRWQGLHQLTRDRSRNLLFGHLGLAEDEPQSGLELSPDCADAPYMYRAYFAWKLGLPFGRHECRFGSRNGPPECGAFRTNRDPVDDPPQPNRGKVARFGDWVRQLKDDVHARSLRTELGDDVSDLYPLELTRAALRPGAVYSDPYGHTLTLTRWIPQRPGQDGALLAVDAQPDGSLRIKRFWRGTFLFPDHHPIQGHGFKAFRPIVTDGAELRPLSNDEIAFAGGYGDVSLEQAGLRASEFYARIAQLINPRPLPPVREYRALHEALHAQLELRVTEVRAAEEILSATPGRVIPMPIGRAIFHAGGAWEALSTPCRDMRLLVGMDVLLGFPEQARAASGGDEKLVAELAALHRTWSEELVIRYKKSDGTEQVLTLAELLERRVLFEMAYNPNDCPERRWGAADGSGEMATCQRRAPALQEQQMRSLRHWFGQRYACG